MTISSWRLSSCEDPLLFEIPADTSQPKGDAIQAVHNFLGDLAQCGEPRHPCHGAIHQPLDFPALAPPVNQLGPDGPNMAHVGPVGPHRRPCGPSLDHRRQVCSLDPHCWMAGNFSNPWKLKYPGKTSSMWCDWVQLQHRCSIIDLKTPLESRALTRKQCRLEQSNTIGLNWITIPTEKDSLLLRAALSGVQVHVLENCSIWLWTVS